MSHQMLLQSAQPVSHRRAVVVGERHKPTACHRRAGVARQRGPDRSVSAEAPSLMTMTSYRDRGKSSMASA
jgi:hypothetical protein